jgi:hypothetical protein
MINNLNARHPQFANEYDLRNMTSVEDEIMEDDLIVDHSSYQSKPSHQLSLNFALLSIRLLHQMLVFS